MSHEGLFPLRIDVPEVTFRAGTVKNRHLGPKGNSETVCSLIELRIRIGQNETKCMSLLWTCLLGRTPDDDPETYPARHSLCRPARRTGLRTEADLRVDQPCGRPVRRSGQLVDAISAIDFRSSAVRSRESSAENHRQHRECPRADRGPERRHRVRLRSKSVLSGGRAHRDRRVSIELCFEAGQPPSRTHAILRCLQPDRCRQVGFRKPALLFGRGLRILGLPPSETFRDPFDRVGRLRPEGTFIRPFVRGQLRDACRRTDDRHRRVFGTPPAG